MVKNLQSMIGLKIRIATTETEIQSCEGLIEHMFGRVMRFGIEPVELEKTSAHIKYLYCSKNDGAVSGVLKVIDADYLARSKEFLQEYRLDQLPRKILGRTVVVVGLCALPTANKWLVTTKLMFAVQKRLLQQKKFAIVSLIKPGLYWKSLTVGYRPFATMGIGLENGGYRVPVVALLNNPQTVLQRTIIWLCRCPPVKTEPGLEADLAILEKSISSSLLSAVDYQMIDNINLQKTIFRSMSEKSIRLFFKNSVVVCCKQGDLIIKQGATDRCVYFVLEGSVAVVEQGELKASYGVGEYFGEIAFLLKTPRSADVTAESDTTRVGIISLNAVENIQKKRDVIALWKNISRSLSERILTSEDYEREQ